MSRITFLTCHLTGTGHLVRTLALAKAAVRRGHEVTVITGGRPLAHLDMSGLEVVQLPPVTVCAFEFSALREPDGSPVSDGYMAKRLRLLEDHLWTTRPDALVTELFPLGRRVLADEFMGAIAAARGGNASVAVLSSVRDIPEPKPKRLTEAATRLLKHYDGVLVHGDEGFLPLATTWPLPNDVAPMVHHVGYVGGGVQLGPDLPRTRTVLVSVGGGVLGRRLLGVAAKAAGSSTRPWHLLVGGGDAGTLAGELSAQHPSPNLTIEPARADYRVLLGSAACSISLCGYNTAVELAACTTPAILVPSEEAGEAEQLIRARRLAEFHGITLMRGDTLNPDTLARAAETLALGPPRAPVPLSGDDGDVAVQTIEHIIGSKP